MNYKEKLEIIKKNKNYTQSQLSLEIGFSFPTINSWLNGKSKPNKKAREIIDSLYLKCSGDISLKVIDKKKIEKLNNLKKKHKDPLLTLLKRKDLYDELLLSLTYHTNSIEGSTFNEPEVKAVLFDNILIPNKSLVEHQEVKNHQGAVGYIIKWLSDKKNKDIDEKFIKKIHSILTNGILFNAGQYRNHSVRVVGSKVITTNWVSIHSKMSEFIKLLNSKEKDMVKHISLTHSFFEKIHPFSDGNGRVGRLVMLTLALKNKYAPPIIKKENKIAYYRYLEESQENNNILPLNSFIYECLFNGYDILE
jgi:Fic family protein